MESKEQLDRLLKHIDIDNGFFVEAGAHDGVEWSWTLELEKSRGWTGILVEPSVVGCEACIKNRPHSLVVHGALVSDVYPLKDAYGDFDGSPMASVGGWRRGGVEPLVKAPAFTLTSVLEKYNASRVDLFCLDVEGYEWNVLKGLDFNRWRPTFILVEMYDNRSADINGLLLSRGYAQIENITDYNWKNNPSWDGTHNDFLYKC